MLKDETRVPEGASTSWLVSRSWSPDRSRVPVTNGETGVCKPEVKGPPRRRQTNQLKSGSKRKNGNGTRKGKFDASQGKGVH